MAQTKTGIPGQQGVSTVSAALLLLLLSLLLLSLLLLLGWLLLSLTLSLLAVDEVVPLPPLTLLELVGLLLLLLAKLGRERPDWLGREEGTEPTLLPEVDELGRTAPLWELLVSDGVGPLLLPKLLPLGGLGVEEDSLLDPPRLLPLVGPLLLPKLLPLSLTLSLLLPRLL